MIWILSDEVAKELIPDQKTRIHNDIKTSVIFM